MVVAQAHIPVLRPRAALEPLKQTSQRVQMPETEDLQGPLADTEYHRVSSRLLGIANRLRELGVESALQVPTLVIAGDQSSGKSSVVEAIAGVALPRSDGTCTRCPTEVRMQ